MEKHGKTIRLDVALWARLERLAKLDKRSVNAETELAIEEFVAREEGRRGLGPLETPAGD